MYVESGKTDKIVVGFKEKKQPYLKFLSFKVRHLLFERYSDLRDFFKTRGVF